MSFNTIRFRPFIHQFCVVPFSVTPFALAIRDAPFIQAMHKLFAVPTKYEINRRSKWMNILNYFYFILNNSTPSSAGLVSGVIWTLPIDDNVNSQCDTLFRAPSERSYWNLQASPRAQCSDCLFDSQHRKYTISFTNRQIEIFYEYLFLLFL